MFETTGRFCTPPAITYLIEGVHATTHDISDIDNRVAKKFQYFAYLPAARRPRWSRVFQGTIDSLSMGEGMIEGRGRFQPFSYPVIPFPDYSLLVRYNGTVAS